jgi:hypothetical protein
LPLWQHQDEEQARKEQRVALGEQLERLDQREADIRQAALDSEAEQQQRGRKRRRETDRSEELPLWQHQDEAQRPGAKRPNTKCNRCLWHDKNTA